MKTHGNCKVLSALSATILMIVSLRAAESAPLALVDAPLFLALNVKPNLIMAIDDSGSMDFEVSFPTNDGAAWWRYGPVGNCDAVTDNNSYAGCTSNAVLDTPAAGELNFDNSGNSATNAAPFRKSAYLFPNGCNSASTSFQKRNCALHHAIPPLPQFGWARSSEINRAYFDPNVSYKPWVDGGGLTFTDAPPTAAPFDPVFSPANTIDLTQDVASNGQIPAEPTGTPYANCSNASLPANAADHTFTLFSGMTLPAGTCIRAPARNWESVSATSCVVGAANGCSVHLNGDTLTPPVTYTMANNSEVSIRYFPATFYLPATAPLAATFGYTGTSLNGVAPDGSALIGYEIKPGNFANPADYTAMIANFANWFTYYRKRHQALRAGLGQSFSAIEGVRVAGFRINQNPGTNFAMADIDVPADRDNLYQQFYQNWTGSGGTPNRTAVSRIISSFRRTNANAPVTYSCQKNFGMLFTDGFSNPPAWGDGISGNFGNVDGAFAAPYADGIGDTIADAVMSAYVNPLRTGPGFPPGFVTVPPACGSAPVDPRLDCNTNLHMNFYAITLNSRGLAFDPDGPPNALDPFTATPTWPVAFPARHPAAVDDLWHAALNGRGKLLNARRPSDIADRLAEVLQSVTAREGSAASASVNSTSINSETRVFQAKFDSEYWSGSVLSWGVNADGTLDNSRHWDTQAITPFASPATRKIITRDSSNNAVAFKAASLDAARLAQLDADPFVAAEKLDYLRGDTSRELPAPGGIFRSRNGNLLGDIVNSSPAFVGRPSFLYRDTLEAQPYSAYRTAQAGRRGVLYVGANDGMLHAFDAETGVELFAYVPGAVFQNLHYLTSPNYSHRYYVDGTPTVGDAFVAGQWRTMLVSGLNKGGQSVFALDVTDPNTVSDGTPNLLAKWEFTDADDADLGYSYSRPAIVRMHNGRWAAVFGNGYNNTQADGSVSATGDAVLFVVDLETGVLIKKIDTNIGTAAAYSGGRPNGLATPAMVDINGDSIVDYAYAGDLFGNLWKFNLQDADPANWDVAYTAGGIKQPIYVAQSATNQRQPITVRPEVTRGPQGRGMMVVFGTGKYLEPNDELLNPTRVQSFYGVLDRNTGTIVGDILPAPGRGNLTRQTITDEQTLSFGSNSYDVRSTSANPLGTNRGWYIDLVSPSAGYQAEMQVTDPIIRDGRVIFTTLIPDSDPCSYGGSSWLMEMDALTGARLEAPPFDLNGDGKFTADDLVNGLPPSGVRTQVGITPKPAVLTGNNGNIEFKFMPGTTGQMQVLGEHAGAGGQGRQSWRQLR